MNAVVEKLTADLTWLRPVYSPFVGFFPLVGEGTYWRMVERTYASETRANSQASTPGGVRATPVAAAARQMTKVATTQ
jgi:hypothetical protein